MAQEHKRGNREVKKPKAIKAPVDPKPSVLTSGSLTPIKPMKKG